MLLGAAAGMGPLASRVAHLVALVRALSLDDQKRLLIGQDADAILSNRAAARPFITRKTDVWSVGYMIEEVMAYLGGPAFQPQGLGAAADPIWPLMGSALGMMKASCFKVLPWERPPMEVLEQRLRALFELQSFHEQQQYAAAMMALTLQRMQQPMP